MMACAHADTESDLERQQRAVPLSRSLLAKVVKMNECAHAACGFETFMVTSMRSFKTASLLRPYSALRGGGQRT